LPWKGEDCDKVRWNCTIEPWPCSGPERGVCNHEKKMCECKEGFLG